MIYKLAPNSRSLLAGKTGSGKTFLARHILASSPRLVVIDPKSMLTDWDLTDTNRDSLRALEEGEDVRLRVTKPENYLPVLARAYAARDVMIYIDEVYAVVPPGDKPPKEFTDVWTRGRELNIGAMAATQRPVWIPIVLMSEAENYFIFRLNMEEDRKRVTSFTDVALYKPVLDRYGFWFYNSDSSKPVYIQKYKESTKDVD